VLSYRIISNINTGLAFDLFSQYMMLNYHLHSSQFVSWWWVVGKQDSH